MLAQEVDGGHVEKGSDGRKASAEATEAPINEPDQIPVGSKFEPVDLKTAAIPESNLPPEIWTIVQSTPANFAPQYFLDVSRNLLENPNLTASHLSRAELSYTSFTDPSFNPEANNPHELAGIVKHLKPDHQPLLVPGGVPGYKLEWTVVRKLIPRNPKLDEALLQSCHLYTSSEQTTLRGQDGVEIKVDTERYLVVYIPHVSDAESIPFYHPKVRGVAILYTYYSNPPPGSAPGTLSLFYDLFPEKPLENRMERTALKMLEIIHKHARGREQGYQKRVHHDVIIPQKTFQDTYAYLKGKYARELIDGWVEQTPAEKHVFEDLGIAAFLIELWTNMYGGPIPEVQTPKASSMTEGEEKAEIELRTVRQSMAQVAFPGFVDIGCGNGLLIYILNKEGWKGWGFDARRRKTWETFGKEFETNVKEMLLVPEILQNSAADDEAADAGAPPPHNGLFPQGTFIVSNHADELTAWTPVLAYLSESPFIAIPCCSHNFGGTRFRAPYYPKLFPSAGSKGKQVSAYMSLCSYVAQITALMKFVPEKEHLRIPSTRNIAIIGRKTESSSDEKGTLEERMNFVKEVVEKEMGAGTSIEQVRLQWLKRGGSLLKGSSGGH